jgi:hypothetical protein
VCERFINGSESHMHQDGYASFGGLNKASHILAGLGERLSSSSGSSYFIEKKGIDGRFYRINTRVPIANMISTVYSDNLSLLAERLIKIQKTIVRKYQGYKLSVKINGVFRPLSLGDSSSGYTLGAYSTAYDYVVLGTNVVQNPEWAESYIESYMIDNGGGNEDSYIDEISKNLTFLETYGIFTGKDVYLKYNSADSIKNIGINGNKLVGDQNQAIFRFDVVDDGTHLNYLYYDYPIEGEIFELNKFRYSNGSFKTQTLKTMRKQIANLFNADYGAHYRTDRILACDDPCGKFVTADFLEYNMDNVSYLAGDDGSQTQTFVNSIAFKTLRLLNNSNPPPYYWSIKVIKKDRYTDAINNCCDDSLKSEIYIQTDNSYNIGLGYGNIGSTADTNQTTQQIMIVDAP